MPAPCVLQYRLFALVVSLLGLFFRLSGAAASPQTDYLVEHWNTESGLPQNTVHSITQTPEGYLWFATFNGLARFDGIKFTVFDPVNTPAMRSGRIMSLQVDRHGALWIFCEEGHLTRFAGGVFEVANGTRSLPAGPVVPKGIDPAGNVWLGMMNVRGLYRLDGDRFKPGGYVEYIAADEVDQVHAQRGGLWLAAGNDWRLVETEPYQRHLASRGLIHPAVGYPARDGGVWVQHDSGVWHLPGGRARALSRPTGVKLFGDSGLGEDTSGCVWIASTATGLHVASPDGRWTVLPTDASGVTADLRSLFIDREENVWVGSHASGVYRVKRRVFRNFAQPEGLGGEVIKSVVEDSAGNMAVAFQRGIDRLTPAGTVQRLLVEDDVWSLGANRSGTLWFGGYSGGVGRLLNGTRAQCPYEGAISLTARCMTPDPDGETVWFGGIRGVWQIRGTNVTRLTFPAGPGTGDVRDMAFDSKGRMYVALGSGGLLRRDTPDRAWSHFGVKEGLPDENLLCVYAGAGDDVWIGGTTGGLSRFRDGKFVPIRPRAPVLPNLVSSLVEDNHGYLWFGGVKGIHRVAVKQLNDWVDGKRSDLFISSYGTEDGLGTSECSYGMQPTVCKGRDGRLWFATLNGLALVDPKTLPFDSRPPPVVIEDIVLDGQVQPSGGTSLVVPPGNRRVEIHYTALSLTAPEKIRFKHRLDGLDQDWTDVGGRRIAYFQGLAPGDYKFRVIACNSDGVWNATGATVALAMQPYFWQTVWFSALCGVVLLAGAGGAYHVRVSALQRRRQAQEAFAAQLIESQEAERRRIAAELHDSLGQNLLLIKNRAAMGRDAGDDPGRVRLQLDHILNSAGQAIEEVRAIAFALRPAELDRLGLANAARAMIRKVGEATPVKFELDLDDVGGCLTPAQEIGAYRVLQEAVSNVLRHSGATEVMVELKLEPELVRLSVFDNGRGFDPNTVGTGAGRRGLGVSGMAERVAILRGEYELLSQPGRGTRVTVRLRRQPAEATTAPKKE